MHSDHDRHDHSYLTDFAHRLHLSIDTVEGVLHNLGRSVEADVVEFYKKNERSMKPYFDRFIRDFLQQYFGKRRADLLLATKGKAFFRRQWVKFLKTSSHKYVPRIYAISMALDELQHSMDRYSEDDTLYSVLFSTLKAASIVGVVTSTVKPVAEVISPVLHKLTSSLLRYALVPALRRIGINMASAVIAASVVEFALAAYAIYFVYDKGSHAVHEMFNAADSVLRNHLREKYWNPFADAIRPIANTIYHAAELECLSDAMEYGDVKSQAFFLRRLNSNLGHPFADNPDAISRGLLRSQGVALEPREDAIFPLSDEAAQSADRLLKAGIIVGTGYFAGPRAAAYLAALWFASQSQTLRASSDVGVKLEEHITHSSEAGLHPAGRFVSPTHPALEDGAQLTKLSGKVLSDDVEVSSLNTVAASHSMRLNTGAYTRQSERPVSSSFAVGGRATQSSNRANLLIDPADLPVAASGSKTVTTRSGPNFRKIDRHVEQLLVPGHSSEPPRVVEHELCVESAVHHARRGEWTEGVRVTRKLDGRKIGETILYADNGSDPASMLDILSPSGSPVRDRDLAVARNAFAEIHEPEPTFAEQFQQDLRDISAEVGKTIPRVGRQNIVVGGRKVSLLPVPDVVTSSGVHGIYIGRDGVAGSVAFPLGSDVYAARTRDGSFVAGAGVGRGEFDIEAGWAVGRPAPGIALRSNREYGVVEMVGAIAAKSGTPAGFVVAGVAGVMSMAKPFLARPVTISGMQGALDDGWLDHAEEIAVDLGMSHTMRGRELARPALVLSKQELALSCPSSFRRGMGRLATAKAYLGESTEVVRELSSGWTARAEKDLGRYKTDIVSGIEGMSSALRGCGIGEVSRQARHLYNRFKFEIPELRRAMSEEKFRDVMSSFSDQFQRLQKDVCSNTIGVKNDEKKRIDAYRRIGMLAGLFGQKVHVEPLDYTRQPNAFEERSLERTNAKLGEASDHARAGMILSAIHDFGSARAQASGIGQAGYRSQADQNLSRAAGLLFKDMIAKAAGRRDVAHYMVDFVRRNKDILDNTDLLHIDRDQLKSDIETLQKEFSEDHSTEGQNVRNILGWLSERAEGKPSRLNDVALDEAVVEESTKSKTDVVSDMAAEYRKERARRERLDVTQAAMGAVVGVADLASVFMRPAIPRPVEAALPAMIAVPPPDNPMSNVQGGFSMAAVAVPIPVRAAGQTRRMPAAARTSLDEEYELLGWA